MKMYIKQFWLAHEKLKFVAIYTIYKFLWLTKISRFLETKTTVLHIEIFCQSVLMSLTDMMLHKAIHILSY